MSSLSEKAMTSSGSMRVTYKVVEPEYALYTRAVVGQSTAAFKTVNSNVT